MPDREPDASQGRVLWVGKDPPKASRQLEIVVERDEQRACAVACDERWDAVVVEAAEPQAVRAVLSAARCGEHGTQRIAASTYDELPELVRVVEDGVIERVVAMPVDGAQLARMIFGQDPSES
ncbi:MAG: hypothetical protein KUG77_01080, partial [Nannocystaceae bacterium]|nr:hypothetical protein [Nannocystaceae bacterium]